MKEKRQKHYTIKSSPRYTFIWFPDSYSLESKSLPTLTSMNRTEWAKCRGQYFSKGVNKDSLNLVESAIFHVSICDLICKLCGDYV